MVLNLTVCTGEYRCCVINHSDGNMVHYIASFEPWLKIKNIKSENVLTTRLESNTSNNNLLSRGFTYKYKDITYSYEILDLMTCKILSLISKFISLIITAGEKMNLKLICLTDNIVTFIEMKLQLKLLNIPGKRTLHSRQDSKSEKKFKKIK